jgi:transglutaminase-like putative cysteine protease
MREEFMNKYLPVAAKAKSSGEAALALNRFLFDDYKVVYNTMRLRTDQSSRESITQGMATCTGLSIMLVEACRAIGIPARMAGIHTWPGKTGNHTWVEIWDNGWHFVGAAEPDAKGLNHAWFTDQAKTAVEDDVKHAIFAVSYKKTGTYFPLAWNPEARINAVNVTTFYKER